MVIDPMLASVGASSSLKRRNRCITDAVGDFAFLVIESPLPTVIAERYAISCSPTMSANSSGLTVIVTETGAVGDMATVLPRLNVMTLVTA